MSRRSAVDGDGRRRATIRDVAALAGVSVATVSRVLAGNYPTTSATKAKVMRAVRELDYVVNAHARALAGASPKTVAILVASITPPYYSLIAEGVQKQAAQEGRLCLVCGTDGDPDRELAVVGLMREQRADAVIIVGSVIANDEYRARMSQYAQALAAAGSRLVLCGRPPLGNDVPALVVEYDNTGGAQAITSHLLSAGHDRILYLGRRTGHTTSDLRVEGYRQALRAHRVPHDESLELDGGFERTDGYEVLSRRLSAGRPDFTAIFACNDQVAAGAIQALREHGLRVPEDMSVVGYDDVSPAVDLGLTTVHIPHDELGRTAVRMALGSGPNTARAGGNHVLLGTHIVVRDSVRPRRRKRV